jgi:hypothetical protein
MSTVMPIRVSPQEVAGQVLRSITSVTGALAGGLGIAVPILAATFYEMKFGRPSSTSGLAIPFAIIWAGLVAAIGGAVGGGIRRRVARTRWAGPMDRRVAAILLVLVVTVPTVWAIHTVRRIEAQNSPRVIRSSGEVLRTLGSSDLAPVRPATFVWAGYPDPNHPREELRWNGRRVDVRVVDDRLIVSAGELPTSAIDISTFDYAREMYGITATLTADGQEWLALLVQLRATGHRELLFIFNPNGMLVHEELLEPRGRRMPGGGLVAAGAAGSAQEIVLDRGVPIRYYVGGP